VDLATGLIGGFLGLFLWRFLFWSLNWKWTILMGGKPAYFELIGLRIGIIGMVNYVEAGPGAESMI
jgi:hypothetical protein